MTEMISLKNISLKYQFRLVQDNLNADFLVHVFCSKITSLNSEE